MQLQLFRALSPRSLKLQRKSFQFNFSLYFSNHQPEQAVEGTAFGIVGGGDITGPVLPYQVFAVLPWRGLVFGRLNSGILHGDCRPALVFDHFHGRHVGFAIADIDHLPERYGALLLRKGSELHLPFLRFSSGQKGLRALSVPMSVSGP